MFYLVGVGAWVVGSSLFVGSALIWYFMAKWECAQAFQARCPESRQLVEIRVDAGHAARTRFHGHEEMLLTSCSQSDHGCKHACLTAAAPNRKPTVIPGLLKQYTLAH